MAEGIILLVIGGLFGSLSTIIIDRINKGNKKNEARKLLLAEFTPIKKGVPGLLNSFNNQFGMMINVNYTNSPIESGSFEEVRADLLSLNHEELSELILFYKSIKYCQDQFEKIYSIKEKSMKTTAGVLIQNSLEGINNKLTVIEAILSK